jgi:cyclic pyranopterin phosphate synthase
MAKKLSHISDGGDVCMVDIGGKKDTVRTAVAYGEVVLARETLALIRQEKIPKGNVFNTARIAGIMAAKRVAGLIPLCHQLSVTSVAVDFKTRRDKKNGIIGIESRVRLVAKTGAEMEALTAVAVAALTIYDMCKAVDAGIELRRIRLLSKRGGRSDRKGKKRRSAR